MRYEVVLSTVVEAETEDEAIAAAFDGRFDNRLTIIVEDGVRIIPDDIFEGNN